MLIHKQLNKTIDFLLNSYTIASAFELTFYVFLIKYHMKC